MNRHPEKRKANSLKLQPQRRIPLFDDINATFFVSTVHGLEEELCSEIESLAEECRTTLCAPPIIASAGVEVKAPWSFCYALNLGLRCASRVLCEIAALEVRSLSDVHDAVSQIEWSRFFSADKRFVVNASSSDQQLAASALNLKIKDAIADSFVKTLRRRPDVDKANPDVRVMARFHRGLLTVSLDTTGTPLSVRGYRVNNQAAPMNELLASGLIRMTGWHSLCQQVRSAQPEKVSFARVAKRDQGHSQDTGTTADTHKARRIPQEIALSPDFIDPMCGTGTLAIEAALHLLNRRPQMDRTEFAFEHLSLFSEHTKKKLEPIRRALRANELSLVQVYSGIHRYLRDALGRSIEAHQVEAPILCCDQDTRALAAAQKNAEAAGVARLIRFERRTIEQLRVESDAGLIVMNPPYGVRMGDVDSLKQDYKKIGDTLKQNCRGWQAWILTENESLAGSVGLRATRRKKVFNGGLECLWLQYVLF
jgi:23S rRNA G2445 N2-methylase RlmL